MTTTETLHAYAEAKKAAATGRETKKQYEAALSLPQSAERAEAVSQADGIVRGGYALQMWEHAVSGAATELRDIIEAMEAGTSSDPLALIEEAESAARDLLHLLGVSE